MAWEFKRRGKSFNAHVKGRLVFNSSDLMVAAALTDHGLIWVPADIVEEHVAAGRLILVLDDWAITYPGYHLYYASRRASPALTLVVEALRYSGRDPTSCKAGSHLQAVYSSSVTDRCCTGTNEVS